MTFDGTFEGMDILGHGQWGPAVTLQKLVLGVQSILDDPCLELLMEPELGNMAREVTFRMRLRRPRNSKSNSRKY